MSKVYNHIIEKCKESKKMFALLIDPDMGSIDNLKRKIDLANENSIDLIFVGGSLLVVDQVNLCLEQIKKLTNIPVVLFPGNPNQVNKNADAILFLSLISGRNPELLIGQHVLAAPYIIQSGLEPISTGYMLIESGKYTTVQYVSNTMPIPSNKSEVAMCTAIAGEMLGNKAIFMDAGSGATQTVPIEMIKRVKQNISIPLIIGGGIKTAQKAKEIWEAGADIIVIGNALDSNPDLIKEISSLR